MATSTPPGVSSAAASREARFSEALRRLPEMATTRMDSNPGLGGEMPRRLGEKPTGWLQLGVHHVVGADLRKLERLTAAPEAVMLEEAK